MAKLSVLKGATSILVRVFIQDSSSTTGAGLTGLVFNSGSLVCYRMRDDDGNAGATAITLATATLGTWATGGFKEKDATNAPGWYEFGVPNAALATGSRSVSIHMKGATNMAPLAFEIELTGIDNQDAVRAGMTALPNAAAEAAGGLYTRGTGAGQIKQDANGRVDVNVRALLDTAWLTPGTAGTPDVNVKLWNALTTVALPLIPTTAGRTLDVSVGGEAGLDWANVGSPTTAVDLSSTTIKTTQKVDVDTIKTQALTAAAGITFPTSIASPTNITAGTITTATNLTNAPTAGDFTATMKTSLNNSTPNALRTGTAQAGAATTITLDSGAVATNSYYNNSLVILTGGTGAGQARFISAYVGATKVATVGTWVTNPDNTTTFSILGFDAVAGATAPTVAQIATGIWQDLTSGSDFSTASSVGKLLKDNIDAVLSAIKTQTDKMTFTVANQMDSNVIDWKGATAPAMTGDAYARLGAPAGASVSADVAAVKVDTAAVKAKTDNLPAAPAATGDAMTLTSGERTSIGTALLDLSNGIETSITLRQALRLILAANAGKLSGGGTTTVVIRNATDSKDRITATVDISGNRSAVTLDAT